MSDPLPSVKSTVADLGGITATAELFGCGETAVHNWVRRDAFPSWTFFGARDALTKSGRPVPEELWRKDRTHRTEVAA
jgi:hypothetical protein